MPLPPPTIDMEQIKADIHWLVEEIGPRPYRSEAAQLTALGLRDRLKEAGWKTEFVQLSGNLVACRGKGRRLFLAHTDTVPKSPGAVDNAAGVVALIAMARHSQATDLCLAFPVGEEWGLLGSIQMNSFLRKWHPSPKDLDTVVSLDLTGHGELSITGLGPSWGEKNLKWLYSHIQPHSEYGYQVVSRLLPSMERSDHAPFAKAGHMSFQFLGRNQDGIYPYYHQKEDQKIDLQAMSTLLQSLETLATAPPAPPPSNKHNVGLVLGTIIIPSWLIWLTLLGGVLSSALEIKKWKQSIHDLGKGLLFLFPMALILYICTQFSLFEPTLAERTAAKVMRIKPGGWWVGAIPGVLLALLIFFLLRWKCKPRGSAAFLCGIFLVPMLFVDPILAFPMAVAAILSRLWGPLAILGGLYWISPAILRELSFHGFLPASYWIILFILILPAAGKGHFPQPNVEGS